jgi:hypothetical protein
MIQKYRSNIVITDLFATDEQLHLSEKQWLLCHMKSIQKLKITNKKQ